MKIIDKILNQFANPEGFLGKLVLKTMFISHKRIMNWALSYLKLDKEMKVLDIGCGDGKTIKRLLELEESLFVYGIDISSTSINMAKKENRFYKEKGQVIIKQSGVSALPYLDDFFDIITAFNTHYFWPDLAKDLLEVKRVLKPGAQLAICARLELLDQPLFKDKKQLSQKLRLSGFKDIICYDYLGYRLWLSYKA